MTKRNLFSIRSSSVSIAAILAAGALAACSGGGSSGGSTQQPGSGGTTPPPPPSGEAFQLDGTVSKGLILGGAVTVSDPEDSDRVLLQGTTSTTDGSYSLNIPSSAEFDGSYVRVTVVGGNGAEMTCDAPSGCGMGVAFGDRFAIGSDVSIQALVGAPGDGGTATVNVTALTDLAAALADDQGGLTDEVIENANSQVADLFGIVDSNLSSLPVVDVTAADVAGEPDAIRSALVNSGILGGLFEGTNTLDVGLETLRTRFVDSNGQMILNETVDDPDLVSLEDILSGALDTARLVTTTDEDIEDAIAELGDDVLTVRAGVADTLSDAAPSPNAALTALEKGKAFVSDLQLITTALDDPASESSFTEFGESVEAAADLISEDAENVVLSYVEGIQIVLEAYNAFESDNTLTSFQSDAGVAVQIAPVTNGAEFTIAETDINGITVAVASRIVLEGENPGSQDISDASAFIITDILRGDGEATFSGTASSAGIQLTVQAGELSLADLEVVDVETLAQRTSTFEATESVAIGELVAQFSATLSERSEGGLSFQGIIEIGAQNFLSEDGSFFAFRSRNTAIGGSTDVDFFVEESTSSLRALSLGLSGQLSLGDQSTDVTLRTSLNGDNVALSSEVERTNYAEYEVANNEIDVRFPPFSEVVINEVYGIDSIQDVDAFIANFDPVFQLPLNGTVNFSEYLSQDGSTRAVILSDGSDDEFLTIQRAYEVDAQLSFDHRNLFGAFQRGAFGFLFGTGEPSSEFLASPPVDDIVEYISQGLGLAPNSFVQCGAVNNVDTLLLIQDFRFKQDESPITAFPLRTVTSCDDFLTGNGLGFQSFNPSSEETLNPDAAADILFSASLRQNVVGVDPDNPGVEISVFGDAALANNEVTGDLTTRVAFAGRRFETNALGFDLIESGNTFPLEIRNQDAGVMTVNRDATTSEISGTLTIGGEDVGTVEEDDNGVILVRFTDGTFVSLL